MARTTGLYVPLVALYAFWLCLAHGVSGAQQEPLVDKTPKTSINKDVARGYHFGEAIPITCLNRTIDTGEHIVDASGQLQYIPFPTCNETGQPLSLSFGVEKDQTCTLDYLSDALYHLLEFYIHNDAPLTCRIPSKPLPPSVLEHEYRVADTTTQQGALGTQSSLYTPLVIALSGTLQRSHLHINTALNLLVHAAPKHISPGTIDAASAYSISPSSSSTSSSNKRVTIGDPLTLSFSIRWYPSTTLPPGWSAVHGYASTLLYCFLSAAATAVVCIAWFRGGELPRRVRRYARDKLAARSGYGLPVANGASAGGFGMGMGGGRGYAGYGYSYGFGGAGAGGGGAAVGKKD